MFTAKVVRKKHVDLNKAARGLRGPSTVKVGLPAGKAEQEVINRGVWNHYGTSGGGWGGPIPERPFLANAMRDNRNEYREAMKTSARKLLLGETSLRSVLAKLGAKAQRDVQTEIESMTNPPNSPVTIALKGSDKPLIETGELHAAITFEVSHE